MFSPMSIMAMTMVMMFNLFAVPGVFGLSTNLTVGELGTLIGLEETTAWSDRTIYAFRGIPYAQAPIGDLRFRPPVKVTTWNGTLDARQFGPACPQNAGLIGGQPSYNEDCLSLNVYVPKIEDQNTTLPVMIWIHGGLFMAGNAAEHQPYYLLEENIVLVTIQFRLGPLGLLCLQTDEVPGNVQFLDQIMAMQWVQDNIAYFGGDPTRVTLFGQSAGAATVNLHQVSPLSKGLFHQAIIQSGSFFAPWVMDYQPLRTATDLGAFVGCNQTNTTELAACYKNLEVQTLIEGFTSYLSAYAIQGLGGFGGHRAVIQTAGTQRFLEEDPKSLIAKGDFTPVPMMGGATKHDGMYFVAEQYFNFFQPLEYINDPEFLQYNATSFVLSLLDIEDVSGGISHTMIHTHFNEEDVGDYDKMVPGFTDICSVITFKAGVFQMVQSNSRLQPSYLYTFSYFGDMLDLLSLLEIVNITLPFELGVPHSAELPHLFPLLPTLSDKDLSIAKKMVSLWTSFAISGKPEADGKTWEPMTTAFGPYLIIEDELYNGTNYLDEYTIALKEGMTAVDRSSASSTSSPHYLSLLAALLWFVLQRF